MFSLIFLVALCEGLWCIWSRLQDSANMAPVLTARLVTQIRWGSVRAGPTMVDEDVTEVGRPSEAEPVYRCIFVLWAHRPDDLFDFLQNLNTRFLAQFTWN